MNSNSSNILSNTSVEVVSREELELRGLLALAKSDLIAAATIVIVIGAFGTMLNGAAVFLTFFYGMNKKRVNILVTNVAMTDFIQTFVLFTQSYYIRNPLDGFYSAFCPWLGLIQYIVAFEMVTFTPYISINRYLSLYHGSMYSKLYTKRNIYGMVIGSWLISLAVSLPYFLGGMTGYDGDNLHCCVMYIKNTFWDTYYLTLSFLPIVVSNGAALLASYKIWQKLRQHVASSTANIDVAAYRDIQRFTILDIVLPIITLMPYYVVKYAYPDRDGVAVRIIMVCLFMMGPLLRGVNILFLHRPYKRALLKLLRINSVEAVGKASSTNASNAKASHGTGTNDPSDH